MKLVISKITFFIVQWSLSLADHCRDCNESDTNINNTNISEKCFEAVEEIGIIDQFEECEDVESASTVSAECKFALFSTVICIDNTYADPCSVCNESDKNTNNTNISEKCYNEVDAWYELKGINEPIEECEDVESASTVSAECKYSLFSTLNCIDNTYADPCSVCDESDKDITQSGISKKCSNAISDWAQISGKKIPKKCDGVDGGSRGSAKCKKAVFSMCSINPCEDDYDNKFKYGNDMYSCKQLNRSKKIHRRKICKREKSARKLCKMICKYKS